MTLLRYIAIPSIPGSAIFEGEALFCPANSVFTCTKNVTIAQRDLDMGSLSGNVTITAITPEGDGIEASAAAVIPLDGASSMALGKRVYLYFGP
ncbi:unnamed protein product [Scytosiphon promiscuus]